MLDLAMLNPSRGRRRQRGFSLMNMMVTGVLSLFAVATMVVLMAGTLGRGSTTIQSSRLAQDLRAAMQLMSRDLRRANYHSSFLQCFGNTNCRADLGIAAHVNTININAAGDCFWYWLDRNGDADLTNDFIGAYRLATVDGVGAIQMRIGGNAAAQCDADAGWELITDPSVVDITAFSVDDAASYTEVLSDAGESQVVEKIRLGITGRLVRYNDVTREIRDIVHVRNDVESPPPVVVAAASAPPGGR